MARHTEDAVVDLERARKPVGDGPGVAAAPVEPPTIPPCSVNTGRKMSSDGLSIGRDFSRYRACGYFLPILLTSAGGVDIHWASCLLRDETPA